MWLRYPSGSLASLALKSEPRKGARAMEVSLAFLFCLAANVPEANPGLALAAPTTLVRVPAGNFHPPFLSDSLSAPVAVAPFFLDAYPVTQSQFAAFVRRHPKWKRDSKPSLFHDSSYLRTWLNDSTPQPGDVKAPATFVSWHAAKAYCADLGRRLPTTMEWERVAQTRAQGQDSVAMQRVILEWYGKPSGLGLDSIGSGAAHAFGVHDLHGLIWEWTSDFRSWGFAKFGSNQVEDSAQYCGGGGNRANSNDYILYMRYGLRSSLQPHFALAALGFRCASDMKSR
jgi:formylglycine-generating enzyme required for sulfatase activity